MNVCLRRKQYNAAIFEPQDALAGVRVTLNGQTEVTDEHGRFVFYAVEPGTYSLTAVLPDGLTADIGPVVVEETRGAVVGVAAAELAGEEVFRLYLPVAVRS